MLTEFTYPKRRRLMVDWMLVIVAFCGALTSFDIRHNQGVGSSVIFPLIGAAFFLFGWLVSRMQLAQITVDEDALHTSALWGLVRRSYKWRDVERIDHDVELELPGQFTLPKTWYLVMKNRRNMFGLQSRFVGATRDLINFPLLLNVFERKSMEFSFPITAIK